MPTGTKSNRLTGPLTAIGAAMRPELEKRVLTDLRQLKVASSNLVKVEVDLAEALWPYRQTFTVKSKGNIVPDYHGRSAGYQASYNTLLGKAGLVVLENTTPFEAKAIDLAVARIEGAVRREMRRIADRELSLADLVAAGFKRSKALPFDQKIPEDTSGTRTPKARPIAEVIGGAIAGLQDAAKRPQDIRDLSIEDRTDLLNRLIEVAGVVGRVLKPTATETRTAVKAPAETLVGQLEASIVQAKAKAPAKAPATAKV